MMKQIATSLFAACILIACQSPVVRTEADLILLGGEVYTLDEKRNWAEAIAIRGGQIIAVGSDDQISTYKCETTEPVEAVTTKIKKCAEESDQEWIIGFGIDLSLFPQNGPDRALLDDIAPERLMFLDASDGHSVWVNSAVLALAHIAESTDDPTGGVIERRPGSTIPNGTLGEAARELANALRPPREHQESTQALREAIELINAAGITSLIDAGVFAKDTGRDFERVLSSRSQYESERISSGSIKMFVDGVMEGETAALVEPYLELGHTGFLNYSEEALFSKVARYEAMGLQIHMHTMGDAAVRAGLDAIEHARKLNVDNPKSKDLRHHLSHLQLVHPDDTDRFAQLNVAANFTAAWAYPDKWVTELNLPVLGSDRVDRMYPIRSIVGTGGVVVGGSDWIYGPLNPLESIEVAITRQDPHDSTGPVGNTADAIDLETALKAYTINAAWLMHQEESLGSIEVGKTADLVVLDRNLFEIPSAQISEEKVRYTFFEGKVVYQASDEN